MRVFLIHRNIDSCIESSMNTLKDLFKDKHEFSFLRTNQISLGRDKSYKLITQSLIKSSDMLIFCEDYDYYHTKQSFVIHENVVIVQLPIELKTDIVKYTTFFVDSLKPLL